MQISLAPEHEKRIADLVAVGDFPSPEEVVREGLRLFFAERERHLAELRVKIQEGVDALERGEYMDGDEFFAKLDDYIQELTGKRP